MARLSVTDAWNETVAFVKAEGRLVFPLAFLLVALPAALVRALAPLGPAPGEARMSAVLIAAIAVAVVLAMLGYLAISHLALRSGASGREALAQAARRLPVLAAASLFVALGLAALGFLLSIVVSLAVVGASEGPPGPAEMGRAAQILLVIFLPILLYFWGRVALLTPAAAAEHGGPFSLIARSWRLTGPHQFKMAALVAMLLLIALVLQLATESLLGILLIAIAGPATPGSPSSILILLAMALLATALASYGAALIAKVYAQLSGGVAS